MKLVYHYIQSYASRILGSIIICALFCACVSNSETKTEVANKIDWPEFLRPHNMVWDSLPQQWKEAPHLGNASIGSMIHQDSNAIKLQLFHANVNDHRDNTFGWTAYSRPRFEIGALHLNPIGKIQGGECNLDIWNAELNGTVKTDRGEIRFRHFVHADDMVIITEISTTEGEREAQWSWHPEKAETTRNGYPRNKNEVQEYAKKYGEHHAETLKLFEPNPKGKQILKNGVNVWQQDLLSGGQYATSWSEIKKTEEERTLFVSISSTYPDNNAVDTAVKSVTNAINSNKENLTKRHRQWWHSYYPKSYVTVPDKALEKLYWNSIYRYGSTARQGRAFVNTAGLWFQGGSWPYVTHDYNTQASHWALPMANRLEQSAEVLEALFKARETLIKNVRPVEWQDDSAFLALSTAPDMIGSRDQDMRYWNLVGNLPWVLHNCWWQYTYSMDDKMLKNKLFPLLRKSINLYLKLIKEEDNKLRLPPTYSPETGTFEDNNFDLGLLRWGCKTLLQSCERLGINDPLIPKWKDVLERLIDYPADERGFRLGTDATSPVNHRHASHLLMIYPLYEVNIDQTGTKEVLNASVERFFNTPGLPAMVMTHAVPLATAIGNGNLALEGLKKQAADLHPNGLWHGSPCIEASLSIANGLQTMLLQDWENTIRVFPAIPDKWKDITFKNLRAQGAFLVSAKRIKGITASIRLKSLAGEPCQLKTDMINPTIAEGLGEIRIMGDGIFEIKIEKGAEIVITPK